MKGARKLKKKIWHKLVMICFLTFACCMSYHNSSVQAATKKYHTKKYYKSRKVKIQTSATTNYGEILYYAKHKERTVIKKTKKVKTVFYKHTKTVTTTKKVKKTKKKYEYSKRKPVIEDVKWYLPDKVYQDFKNEKYHVIQDPGSKLFKDTVNLGVFSARKKAVILREYQSDQKVLLHEMGHYVDLKNNFGSLSQEFIQIYHLESKKIDSLSYSRKDSKEYFAEAFMMYCKYPYTLKKEFPKTYNYIAQTLQDI